MPHESINIHQTTPHASAPTSSAYRKSCGLDIPSRVSWEAGIKDSFPAWASATYDAYIQDQRYSSFPQFLRDRMAPDTVPNGLFCDGVGECSLASCLNLDAKLPRSERQNAYYPFEGFASIAHMYEATPRSIHLNYQRGRVHELVVDFTSAKRLQRVAVEREKTDGVIKGVVTASLLVVGSYPKCGQRSCSDGRGGWHIDDCGRNCFHGFRQQRQFNQ